MIKFLTSLICLAFASSVFGKHICSAPEELGAPIAIRGLASVVGEIGSELNPENSLSLKMCSHSYAAGSNEDPISAFEESILLQIGTDTNDAEKSKKISNFLNEYNQDLICGDDSVNKIRDNEQLFKRSVARGEYVYLQHLANKSDYDVDFNFFEIIDGKKETIVDYIEMIMMDEDLSEDYDLDELRSLVKSLKERGAKRGSEL